MQFQSTLPAGEATAQSNPTARTRGNFNPRFPRGKRQLYNSLTPDGAKFQSTLPAGEATDPQPKRLLQAGISIHASRGGSDKDKFAYAGSVDKISIHASRGGSDKGLTHENDKY